MIELSCPQAIMEYWDAWISLLYPLMIVSYQSNQYEQPIHASITFCSHPIITDLLCLLIVFDNHHKILLKSHCKEFPDHPAMVELFDG